MREEGRERLPEFVEGVEADKAVACAARRTLHQGSSIELRLVLNGFRKTQSKAPK